MIKLLFIVLLFIGFKVYSQKPIYDTLDITITDTNKVVESVGYFMASKFDTLSFNRFVFQRTPKAVKLPRYSMVIPEWQLIGSKDYPVSYLIGKIVWIDN